MHRKKLLAIGGALAVAAVMPAANALAATKVTVRIEGKNKTLLPATVVTPHRGTVRMSGRGCPSATGAGAVALAVHGAWSGTWFSFGFEATKILGETDKYSTTNSYWELFVNNVASQSGICDVKLKRGEQILFAAVPATGTEFPLELIAPRHATAGTAVRVTVKAFDAKGKAKPLARATVAGTTTDSNGTATVTLTHAGKVTLTAADKGYIRAEAQVRVS